MTMQMRSPSYLRPLLLAAGLIALGAGCGDNEINPCECSLESPGLNVIIDWDDSACEDSTFSFGIRTTDSILSFSTSRCSEEDALGRQASAIFDWPTDWFDGDVVPLRHTTQGDNTIAHGADTLIAHPNECTVKILTPACPRAAKGPPE